MRLVLSALLTVASLALSQVALAQSIEKFTKETVVEIVTEAGAKNIDVNESGETTFINFDLGDARYSYSLRLCEKDNKKVCIGLLLARGFLIDSPISLETFNKFNASVPFVTAVKIDEKTMAIGRFVVSLGGITKDNVKVNMALLDAGPALFVEVMKEQVVASLSPESRALLANAKITTAKLVPVALTPAQLKLLMDDKLTSKINLKK